MSGAENRNDGSVAAPSSGVVTSTPSVPADPSLSVGSSSGGASRGSLLTPEQRAALEHALAMPVAGDDLSSCDPSFDFGAYQVRELAIEEAMQAIVGDTKPRYLTVKDCARYLLAADDRLRAAAPDVAIAEAYRCGYEAAQMERVIAESQDTRTYRGPQANDPEATP